MITIDFYSNDFWTGFASGVILFIFVLMILVIAGSSE